MSPRAKSGSDADLSQASSNKDNIIDGKAIAAACRAEIQASVQQMQSKTNTVPGLAVILVGSRPDSQTYVNMKKKACAQVGFHSMGYDFPDTVSQQEVLDCVQQLNENDEIHGILIQLPLPAHMDQDAVLQAVDPDKDVDGLHPANVAKLQLYSTKKNALEAPFSIPCTPLGCLLLLLKSKVPLRGANVVILGRSQLVGWPLARLLLGEDATVTVVHSRTQDLQYHCSHADILVAAVGKPQLVTADLVRPGAVVIDVGINSVPATDPNSKNPYKLVGDVDFDAVAPKCSLITPVPGGVGPMTIAMLLRNTWKAFERSTANQSS